MRDMMRARAMFYKNFTNDADGYFIDGYGHPSYSLFYLNYLLFENVNMSKRDAHKQMVPCG